MKTLDVRGLNCPQPILKTKLALRDLQEGERLTVYATDPHAEIDFKAYFMHITSKLVSCTEEAGVFCFLIEK